MSLGSGFKMFYPDPQVLMHKTHWLADLRFLKTAEENGRLLQLSEKIASGKLFFISVFDTHQRLITFKVIMRKYVPSLGGFCFKKVK